MAEETRKWPWDEEPFCNAEDPYVAWIRSLVGTKPIVLTCAVCAILDHRGFILLEQRTDNGIWSPPGGIIRVPKEEPIDAAVREIYEETKLTVDPRDLHLLAVYGGEKQYHKYASSGDEVLYTKIVYYTHDYEGRMVPNWESARLAFFPLTSIPKQSSGSTRRIVNELLARQG